MTKLLSYAIMLGIGYLIAFNIYPEYSESGSIRESIEKIKSAPELEILTLDEKKKIARNNLSNCLQSKVSDEFRDEYYLEYAPFIGETDLCFKILDNFKRTKCLTLLAEIKQFYKPCELIVQDFDFYWEMINQTPGSEEHKINLARQKLSEDQIIKDKCYENLARITGDITYCENIDQKWARDMCIKDYV